MIVTCPACSTRYLVDPRALGSAGRTVRCANCARTWHQTPPEDAPLSINLEVDELPDAGVPPHYPVPAVARHPRSWTTIALVAAIVLGFGGIVGGAVFARDQVAALWPPTARLYALLGLSTAPLPPELEVRNIVPRRDAENGTPVLIIDGEVANVSKSAHDVPPMRAILSDQDGNPVQNIKFKVANPHLLPGASVPFHATIAMPSPAAASVNVEFADDGG